MPPTQQSPITEPQQSLGQQPVPMRPLGQPAAGSVGFDPEDPPLLPDPDSGYALATYLHELDKLPDKGGADPLALAFAKMLAEELGTYSPISPEEYVESAMGLAEVCLTMDPARPISYLAPFRSALQQLPSPLPVVEEVIALGRAAYGDEYGDQMEAYYHDKLAPKQLAPYQLVPDTVTSNFQFKGRPTTVPVAVPQAKPAVDVAVQPYAATAPTAASTPSAQPQQQQTSEPDDDGVLRIQR